MYLYACICIETVFMLWAYTQYIPANQFIFLDKETQIGWDSEYLLIYPSKEKNTCVSSMIFCDVDYVLMLQEENQVNYINSVWR